MEGRLGDAATNSGTLQAIPAEIRVFAGECRVLGAGEAVGRRLENALGVVISTECMRMRAVRDDGGGVVQGTTGSGGDKFSSSTS